MLPGFGEDLKLEQWNTFTDLLRSFGLMFLPLLVSSEPTMRRAVVLLIPALLFLLAFPVCSGRYNDDFDDGEDIVDFDDNDFAEFEDMNDDPQPEPETAPPPRASSPQPEEDEDEATVELEDGQDGFEDAENQVGRVS